MIGFECGHCREPMEYPSSFGGTTCDCPRCKYRNEIPLSNGQVYHNKRFILLCWAIGIFVLSAVLGIWAFASQDTLDLHYPFISREAFGPFLSGLAIFCLGPPLSFFLLVLRGQVTAPRPGLPDESSERRAKRFWKRLDL